MFFAFDLLYRDGKDLRPLPLIERKRRLVRLIGRVEIPCLHLVEAFDDGANCCELPSGTASRASFRSAETPPTALGSAEIGSR